MITARDYPSAPAGLAKRTPPPGTLLPGPRLTVPMIRAEVAKTAAGHISCQQVNLAPRKRNPWVEGFDPDKGGGASCNRKGQDSVKGVPVRSRDNYLLAFAIPWPLDKWALLGGAGIRRTPRCQSVVTSPPREYAFGRIKSRLCGKVVAPSSGGVAQNVDALTVSQSRLREGRGRTVGASCQQRRGKQTRPESSSGVEPMRRRPGKHERARVKNRRPGYWTNRWPAGTDMQRLGRKKMKAAMRLSNLSTVR